MRITETAFSGPPNLGSGETKILNNNNTPKGGPTACPWSTNNCGPNDEPFSFHVAVCTRPSVTVPSVPVGKHRPQHYPPALRRSRRSDDGRILING